MTYSDSAEYIVLDGASSSNYYETTYEYDAAGLLARTVEPDGTIYRTVYDSLGRPTSTWAGASGSDTVEEPWSPSNHGSMVELTASVYDGGDEGDSTLTQAIMPSIVPGVSTPMQTDLYYNWRDELVAEQQGSVIDYFELDNQGQTVAKYVYGDADLEGSAIGDGGAPNSDYDSYIAAETTYSLDTLERVYETKVYDIGTDDSPLTSYVYYDARGYVSRTTDTGGNDTDYTFDGAGRELTVTTYPGGIDGTPSVITYSFDADGNVHTYTDPDGNVTTYYYDALNRETQMTDPLGNSAYYYYNSAGYMDESIDRDSQIIYYAYDNLGRETVETWHDYYDLVTMETGDYSIHTSYNYLGEVTSTYDPDAAYANTYNYLGQLTSTDNLGSEEGGTPGVTDVYLTSTYDLLGNLTSVGDTTYSYNSMNELTQVSQTPVTDSTYDTKNVYFTYYADGQVETMTDYGSATHFTVDDVNQPVLSYAYSYNGLQQLTGMDVTGTALNLVLSEFETENYENFSWSYDSTGRIHTATNADGTVTYGYDGTSELTSAAYSEGYSAGLGGTTATNSYDLNGNPSGATLNYPEGYPATDHGNNQVTDDGTWAYTYDKNGNLLSQIGDEDGPEDGQSITYTYDFRNRLTSVTDSLTGGNTVVYTYDMDNRMISRNDGGESMQYFVYFGSNMVYSWGQEQPHEMLSTPSGQLLAIDFDTGSDAAYTFWAVTDNQGSVHDLVFTFNGSADGTGDGYSFGNAYLDHIVYNAWGSDIAENLADSLEAEPGFVDFYFGGGLGYTGHFQDYETGQVFDTFREYNTLNDRWDQQDPIFPLSGPNAGIYCGNDPVNEVDPSGLEPPVPQILQRGQDSSFPSSPGDDFDPITPASLATIQLPTIPSDPATPPCPGATWSGAPGSQPGGPLGGWELPGGGSLHWDTTPHDNIGPHWDWVDPFGNKWKFEPGTGKWSADPKNNPNKPQPNFPPPQTAPGTPGTTPFGGFNIQPPDPDTVTAGFGLGTIFIIIVAISLSPVGA